MLEALLVLIPDFAKDLKLNLPVVLQQPELTARQIWGTAVASAMASGNAGLTHAIFAEAQLHLSPEAAEMAKSAAAIMGMTNVYFRFAHLSGNDAYRSIPSHLRMQAVRPRGPDWIDYELWCTAVSAINGCGDCVAAHEQVLRKKGMKEEAIIAAIRIAAVIHGIAVALNAV